MLPTETELGADMKVSRTVVREALMLLEEDGLIRTRRGVGRFVADTLHLGPAGQPGSSSAAAAPLEIDDDGGSTLLASLNYRFGRVTGR